MAVSSPSGDVAGAEEAVALCAALLPPEAEVERVPCSTAGGAPDLIARIAGTGSRRLLLLGHLDTVIAHSSHAPLRRDGERLYGPGTADMKGGVVLALGVARALARIPSGSPSCACCWSPTRSGERDPFVHVERFAGYDACLCFEAGRADPGRGGGVVVRRKAAGTLRVRAAGRAAHSGSAPDEGRNALLALAHAAITVAAHHDPTGAHRLSVVPTVMRSGEAFNVVPAARRADLRHARRWLASLRRGAWRRCPASSAASPWRPGWSGRGRGWTAREHRAAARGAPARGSAGGSSASRAAGPATPATSPPRSR